MVTFAIDGDKIKRIFISRFLMFETRRIQ